MKQMFRILPYKRFDKLITVVGPDDLLMYVDHDDVNPDVVEELLFVVVQHSNTMPKSWIEDAIRHGREKSEVDDD